MMTVFSFNQGSLCHLTLYEYNAANKQIRKIYPGGKKAIEGKTVYDPAKTETYTYNADGTPATKKDRNGQTTSYKNDIHGRVITKTIDKKEIAYTYDASGNRETEQVQEKTATGTAITLTTYKNDEQNRLVAATEEKGDGTKKTTTYVYDNNGNLTRKSMEQTREIDPSNPPKAKFGMYIEGQKDGATKNAKPIVAGTASYEYDVWNQLVKATTGEGTSTYKYNGEGYRTEKTENGKTTRSLYEGDKVILETDENGKETARNIYGTNLIARTVTTKESGTTKEETYSYMYNGHGDVTALLGADGTVAASYYYDAFGNITEQTGSVNNNITYAGYQYDKETDLYYLNARMYDAKTARFLQEDTYLGNAGDPLSLNLYTYCANNPVIYIDPTGHVVAKVGTKGDTVAAIQEDLKKLGYNVKVDGIFGEQTKAAVIKFQKDNGLVVDGIVGNQTLTEINFEQNRQTANAKGVYLPEPEKAAVGQIKGDVSIMTDAKYQQAINNIVEVKSKTNGGSVNTGVVGNELAVQKVNIKSDIPTAAPVTVTPKVPVPAAASAQMSTLTNQVAQVSGYMALANLSSINANKSTTVFVENGAGNNILTKEQASKFIGKEYPIIGTIFNTYTESKKAKLPEQVTYQSSGYTYTYMLEQDYSYFMGVVMPMQTIEDVNGKPTLTNIYKYQLAYTNEPQILGGTILVGPSFEGAGKAGLRTVEQAGISPGDAARIQNAANRTGQEINVVGSRANGTASATSDWDYIMSGNSAQRHSASGSLPRGTAGGEINSMGRETGIDIWTNYTNSPKYQPLDPTKPYVPFIPKK